LALAPPQAAVAVPFRGWWRALAAAEMVVVAVAARGDWIEGQTTPLHLAQTSWPAPQAGALLAGQVAGPGRVFQQIFGTLRRRYRALRQADKASRASSSIHPLAILLVCGPLFFGSEMHRSWRVSMHGPESLCPEYAGARAREAPAYSRHRLAVRRAYIPAPMAYTAGAEAARATNPAQSSPPHDSRPQPKAASSRRPRLRRPRRQAAWASDCFLDPSVARCRGPSAYRTHVARERKRRPSAARKGARGPSACRA
jgi:hypothetical protein